MLELHREDLNYMFEYAGGDYSYDEFHIWLTNEVEDGNIKEIDDRYYLGEI